MVRLFLSVALLSLTGAAFMFPGGEKPTIQEWTVPWDGTRPRDPYVDAQNRVWFVGQRGDYIAYLTPDTGEFKRYELEPGTGPHNLVVDQQGRVWFAGNRNAYIGKLDPTTGAIVKFEMPDPEARDPHTLIHDGQGNLWFTVQGGNFVGRIKTDSGEVDLIPVPTPHARPYGIVLDSSSRPWICQFGTNKISTVDPDSLELTEHVLPHPGARPRRLGVSDDGMVWYVDYARGYVGRLNPSSGEVQEWATPGGDSSRPYAMALDAQDRIWFVESGRSPNRLIGFQPDRKKFFAMAEIPSGGGTVRHMVFHEPTGALWFGTDTNTIGRAELP